MFMNNIINVLIWKEAEDYKTNWIHNIILIDD